MIHTLLFHAETVAHRWYRVGCTKAPKWSLSCPSVTSAADIEIEKTTCHRFGTSSSSSSYVILHNTSSSSANWSAMKVDNRRRVLCWWASEMRPATESESQSTGRPISVGGGTGNVNRDQVICETWCSYAVCYALLSSQSNVNRYGGETMEK